MCGGRTPASSIGPIARVALVIGIAIPLALVLLLVTALPPVLLVGCVVVALGTVVLATRGPAKR